MPAKIPRSTNHLDFQHLPQTLAVMVKDFPDGFYIAGHKHERHQLLYATSGIMRLYTDNEIWIVPNDRAVYIPAGTVHAVKMYGDVTMHTLYIDASARESEPESLRVILVSDLMRELIKALGREAVVYRPGSRGDKIAGLIASELELAKNEAFNIPLPADARLQTLCSHLLANPSDRSTLDDWSGRCGASPRTLSRLFEQELGMSFRRWRQIIRFHHAIESLAQGKPIKQVAAECGYLSPSAFSAAFQSVIGHAPSVITGKDVLPVPKGQYAP
ncbi:helix-turn-helix transcriptional regulator [Thalassomonas viridans]|uniref:Helix-turn-helix transcriptional regulator n=1 Tax=Thalassomonas viridans TaxID=137584 RepID=A0AAE9Z625_9GAMM|nr:helix-turn-helix transcriptional regulator [Thalassomonas viridans]WDE07421.1 helix-turn-helix transcriptional regulator [Thalassomonas viridans]